MEKKALEEAIAGALSSLFIEIQSKDHTLDKELLAKNFSKHFYNEWFQTYGNSYLIVFRKNLEETNIQMSELLSLIRLATDDGSKFQGISSKDFKKTILNLWIDIHDHISDDIESCIADFREIGLKKEFHNDIKHFIKESGLILPLVDSYYCLLTRTVVIDSYHGTAALHVPPTINIKLEILCGLSGYIHSCGNLILSRDIKKTKQKTVENSFRAYVKTVENQLSTNEKVAFCIYANDKKIEQREDNFGLSSLKLQIDKYYIDQKPLNTVITDIFNTKKNKELNFFKHLEWIDSYRLNEFQNKDPSYFKKQGIKQDRIVWLFVEFGLDKYGYKKKNKKYYVFYEQLYRNTSAYFLYDEEKPAWKAPETIPHSLNAAMINISMAGRGLTTETTINDPFCGSGTTLLESLKYENVICTCCDYSEESKQIMQDNIRFFSSCTKDIERVSNSIGGLMQLLNSKENTLITVLNSGRDSNASEAWKIFTSLVTRLDKAEKKELEIDSITRSILKANNDKEQELVIMILFYIFYKAAHKTIRKEQFKLTSIINSNYFEIIAIKFIEQFYRTIDKHLSLLQFNRRKSTNISTSEVIPKTHLARKTGRFSTWVYPCKKYLLHFYENKVEYENNIQTANIEEKLLQADIYIADPPYGVNVEKELIKLQKMYSGMVEIFVKKLTSTDRRNTIGHIAICVPSETYTGLRSAFFTDPKLLSNQIIANIDKNGGEVLNSADVVPEPCSIFNLPCYWRAPKTLDRAVLFFKISPNILS